MYLKLLFLLYYTNCIIPPLFNYKTTNSPLIEIIRKSKKNNTDIKDILNQIDNINLSDTIEDLSALFFQFIDNYTNWRKENMFPHIIGCLSSLDDKTGDNPNYLGFIGFSGKGISDLGLEEECLRNNFIYYLLTYEYMNGTDVTFSDQRNAFLFFQQNTFFTGLCLPQECNKFLHFMFNETLNDIFYVYLKENLNILNAKIYDIGKVHNESSHINPYDTYDEDGRYNYEKTKNEKRKFNIYTNVAFIIINILTIQFFVSLIIHIFYKPYIKAKELKKEIADDESSYEPEEENENQNIFNKENEQKEKEEKKCKGEVMEFIYNYLSMFNSIKILLKKKNQYYNSSNLEIIICLRILCMILITFINNFEVLIKIPSKDFFDEEFYRKYTFFILKFSSFGVDMWICLDGFESMYKLISYYKKYVFNKNKNSISFKKLIKFYLYSVYKLIAFIIFFLIVNYFSKYFIYFKSENTLYEYYSNHIYNDKLDNKQLFLLLIPGYSFYYSYYLKISIFEDTIISKFSLLLINEFQIYTIFLIIFYISNLLKSKIFDYIILIINIILYVLNYFICQFKSKDNTYYSYKLVLDNFLTVRYPHIVFNYFFFGAMTGLTCYYFKDSFSKNSICSDNENCPFRFCYHFMKFFDYLLQNGRFFWIFLILLLQLFICFSFNIIVKTNNNSIYIPFDSKEKIVLCYETGLFILLFCILIIFLFFIKNENENKVKNHSGLYLLIDRISFSFFNCINLMLYSYYCIFNFQLNLNYQNLWIITFGLFFLVCFENLILTLAFVFVFKMINKKIIKYLFPSEENAVRISKVEELLDKSRDTPTNK